MIAANEFQSLTRPIAAAQDATQDLTFTLQVASAQTTVNVQSGRDGYEVSTADRTYELTRARDAVEYRPTTFLTGLLEFQDTHALGPPIPSVASNMRDQFDLFSEYLNIHYKKVQLITGRQPLNFGSQRLVGVADWTNNSRSWG